MNAVAAELLRERARLDDGERVVGHVFANRALLLTALTHSSYKNEHAVAVDDNEVLEFVGDAVLSLVVVDALVAAAAARGAGVDEGALTERRAAHVSAENLAKASVQHGLDRLVRGSHGFAAAVPKNVAADVVEAVIGAVYRDAGLEAARTVVLRLLGPPPEAVVVSGTHAKRVLQERLQRLLGRAPEYSVMRGDGPNHAPTFHATVSANGVVLGSGAGKNKQAATEAAAAAAVAAWADLDDAALVARVRAGNP
jgi:ribonuclease-3